MVPVIVAVFPRVVLVTVPLKEPSRAMVRLSVPDDDVATPKTVILLVNGPDRVPS